MEGIARRVDGGFELCDRNLTSGLASGEHARLRRHALKAMLLLHESTHLLVQLMVLEGDQIRCVDQFEPPSRSWLSQPVDLGRRWPALQVASGKALLAVNQHNASLRQALPRLAYDDGVTHRGLMTAAVAVIAHGNLFAAVSVSGPQMALARPGIQAMMISFGRQCGVDPAAKVS